MFSGELLPIYLNDHLAGSTAGTDLARRAAKSNRGTEFGDFLARLAGEIEADRAQLEEVMDRLKVHRNPAKVGAGWLAEKLGRLKLNGRLLEYSPLSRVIELEGLITGVNGKRSLWRTLAAAAPGEPRIADIDFDALGERASGQAGELEENHRRATEAMLASRV